MPVSALLRCGYNGVKSGGLVERSLLHEAHLKLIRDRCDIAIITFSTTCSRNGPEKVNSKILKLPRPCFFLICICSCQPYYHHFIPALKKVVTKFSILTLAGKTFNVLYH
jgi:hypothetical protein